MSILPSPETPFLFTPPAAPALVAASTITGPPITALNPVISHRHDGAPWWAAAGSGGGSTSTISTFATASISSLTASTIVAGSVTSALAQSAIDRSALFYTSSLSGSVNSGTSTVLFSLNPAGGNSITGTYFANVNLVTSAVNAAPLTAGFTVGLSGNGNVAVANPLVTNGSGTYDISPSVSGNIVNVYLTNNGGLSPGFTGSYIRIGF